MFQVDGLQIVGMFGRQRGSAMHLSTINAIESERVSRLIYTSCANIDDTAMCEKSTAHTVFVIIQGISASGEQKSSRNLRGMMDSISRNEFAMFDFSHSYPIHVFIYIHFVHRCEFSIYIIPLKSPLNCLLQSNLDKVIPVKVITCLKLSKFAAIPRKHCLRSYNLHNFIKLSKMVV